MTGKVVLITGASSGIGEHLAYEYAKRGAFLVLVARRKKSLQQVAIKARDFGSPSVLVVPADVTKLDECEQFVDAAINNFGRLDHLVNNAGILSLHMFEEISEPVSFQSIMDVNFWGPVYSTYFALPHLKRSRGRIVGVTSFSAYTNLIWMSFYNASKGAVQSFYQTLRIEMAGEIGITEIVPGVIESEITKGKIFTQEGSMVVDQDLRDASLGIAPIERTEDCARSIVSAACRDSRCVFEPPWFLVLYYLRVFMPDIAESVMRFIHFYHAKKLLDLPTVKDVVYPSSLHSPEIKMD